MTLDGHLKTGLAATLLASVAAPFYVGSIDETTLPFILLAYFIGNVAPDFMECRFINLIQHRTHTHYPWYYVVIITALIGLSQSGIIHQGGWTYISISFFLGCLSHIICDIPYGGIPYIFPTRKITLMRIPFDSVANRIVEHGAVIALVMTFVFWNADLSDVTNWSTEQIEGLFTPNPTEPKAGAT
jgi:hypothetical protein